MTPAQRAAVVTAALAWRDTPYHHRARLKGVGVDCVQLLIAVYAEAGIIEAFDPGDYPRDWHLHRSVERYLDGIRHHAARVETPLPGDVALFTFGRCASHAAIVIDWPRVVHAYIGQGVVETDAEQGAELCGRLHSFWTIGG